MKAVLQLLGIAVIETGNQTYLVDVWALAKKKQKKNILGQAYLVLIQRVSRVEHRHLWTWFQRMLRVCEVPPSVWPVGCVDQLKSHDINAFARQRNNLHYATTDWPFNDLHACQIIDGFGIHLDGLLSPAKVKTLRSAAHRTKV